MSKSKKEVLSLSIDLTKLDHRIDEKGNIVLDTSEPFYVKGKKGGVYLSFTARANDKLKFGNTHIITPNVPKSYYDTMSDEQKKQIPIIGSGKKFEN